MSKNLDNVFGQCYYDNQYIGMKIGEQISNNFIGIERGKSFESNIINY